MDLKTRGKNKKIHHGVQQGSESEVDGKGKFAVNSGRKRKRIFADQHVDGKLSYNTKSKDLSKKGIKQMKDDTVKRKNSKGPARSIWVSGRMNNATSKKKHPSFDGIGATESAKEPSCKRSNRSKEEGKLDAGKYDLSKKQSKSKSDSSKRLVQSQTNHPKVPHSKPSKKTFQNKQSVADDNAEVDGQPKKKKRVIRLDPHDISNKRLDDGTVSGERVEEKKKEFEKDAEMSKNAQFRAIEPSPSMLSFVEDNFLGRRRLIELKRAGYNIELSAPLDNIPFSTSSERERIEENIFRNKLTFFASAKVSSSFPPPDLPEIAFAGRSNVGKSSLLNALTRQWGVARTSDKPGLTQTINFFKLGSKVCLVDLPGYGFAYAKEEVKDAWEELVKEYVSTRVGLKRVCLLIDTKWGMKPRDHELIDLMERYQTKYQIVLTKTDVVFPIDVARRATQIEESLKENKSIVQPVMMVSSKSGAGIRSLRTVLSKVARLVKL
ncbi:tRNA modification GTPase MnmE isoform X1 [Manihot esculenta]|uniref:Uncharacterized protein n=6 Tax=Manihot esculenta TaxID=3983 RepID=A0ACB7G1F8_MANES|nr:tRNA modification GTPase MnmE isoform X1 [Manihot esculenta]XP_021601446.1 tRNA modification GTPase MnmE isoform X1 [Manihot esculenta]XP_021601447.1 tRNA modification GTPase MnmE isoform X1 [Manihot esculenta]XP_021601448.1 tRNA modification GTPase MnmE isoform X1 [Manihot esculenta]KAG8633699.1 hypothetical protein MANES_18G137700v8 [Manihot esculenta]KAG8633700.1 hypothetical protein MANES_18G137700v8 [Manihot esculenta]KAG8633701.1 hypothetical protein MANES_18G137700v8 [Manihot escule